MGAAGVAGHLPGDGPDWRLFAIAATASIPGALLGARNLAPPIVQIPIRRLLDILRSIPDLVVATIFLVGWGVFGLVYSARGEKGKGKDSK